MSSGNSFKSLLSTQPIGTKVKIKISGTSINFIVVHQGNPDSNLYDASCDGSWLMMEPIYSNQMWGNNSSYLYSFANAWLEQILFPKLDSNIQPMVKTVKLPYAEMADVYSGANGMECQMFLPSAYELGWTSDYKEAIPEDGACLDYCKDFENADRRRIAKMLNGSYNWYWTRTPHTTKSNYAWLVVSINGDCSFSSARDTYGIRPMMILDKNTPMDIFS